MTARSRLVALLWAGTAVSLARGAPSAPLPKMVSVPAGAFIMGYSRRPLPASLLSGPAKGSTAPPKSIFPDGDADESPAHAVSVIFNDTATTEITNSQYEEYDPDHRALRGRAGFSTGDDEAVVFVSYENASRYAA
eukprot:COSAG03_NODE_10705_length_634_cov_0.693458_1_plen_135_part_10